MKRTITAALSGLLLLAPSALYAQASYTATRSTSIQLGAGGLLLRNDYSGGDNKGVTLFADCDFLRFAGLVAGLEAEVHLGGLSAPDQIGENTYLAGPRFAFHRRRAAVYAKVLIGRGSITNQVSNITTGFNVFAYGGGLEYRIGHKLNLRLIDAELQQWPNFESHTLSPFAGTVGIAYIFR